MSEGFDREVDVIVIGSGAGGLSAAVTAAAGGLEVLVLEKTDLFGGSTAISGGVVWVPANTGMAREGMPDTTDAARRYLRKIIGSRLREDMVEAYLAAAPQMVDFFNAETDVRLVPRMYAPDYYSDEAGAVIGGRPLDPVEYDGRRLGPWFARLRAPLPQMTAFGGMMVSKKDIDHLLGMTRKWSSFVYGSKILLGYVRDRLRFPRGARLLAGNALAARLLRSAIDKGVTLEDKSNVTSLITGNATVVGVDVDRDGERQKIGARLGVVLATGGFAANAELRKAYVPHGAAHLSMAPEGNVGDGIALAQKAGAVVEDGNVNNVFLAPVSVLTTGDGKRIQFPHLILDRQKPGLIAVNSAGRRFVNEANSYHDFVEGMHRSHAQAACIPAYLLCDAEFLRKYGLGLVRPAPFPKGEFLRAGYLIEAPSIAALAERLGLPAGTLEETVRNANDYAQTGIDPEFGKGSTEYNRYLGDPSHRPNPCLGPIAKAPFYAVKVYPGDIGSTRGLKTDARAHVLDGDGRPIPGLFACGNDMNSIMAGFYPAGGITLGPAMTFGYIAAHEMMKAQIKAAAPLKPSA